METTTLTFPLQCSFKRQHKSRNSSSLSLFLGKRLFAISNKISPLSDLKRNLNSDFCTIVQIIKKSSSIHSHPVLFSNKEVLFWHQKTPQYLTFPLKYLQQITQPEHKSWALTDFSHLPFSVNEKKLWVRKTPCSWTLQIQILWLLAHTKPCVLDLICNSYQPWIGLCLLIQTASEQSRGNG